MLVPARAGAVHRVPAGAASHSADARAGRPGGAASRPAVVVEGARAAPPRHDAGVRRGARAAGWMPHAGAGRGPAGGDAAGPGGPAGSVRSGEEGHGLLSACTAASRADAYAP
ncbi:hypothetical protein G6F40_017405 [Rhizopus arrhizus]|nr:hypothetical protein G6F40_017405 [Rhizopus arrhizus]